MSSKGRKVVLGETNRDAGSLSDRFARITQVARQTPSDEGRAARRINSTQRQGEDRYAAVTTRRTGRPAAPARSQGQDSSRGVRRGNSRGRGGRGGSRGGGAPRGGSVSRGRGGGNSRGGRGGRGGGRGGRGGRGGKKGTRENKKPLTKEELDKELESYIFSNEDAGKSFLDKELDDYMAGKDGTSTTEDVEVGGEDVKPEAAAED